MRTDSKRTDRRLFARIHTASQRRIAALVVAVLLAASVGTGVGGLTLSVAASSSNLTVYVAYADNLRASAFFPNPWQGSPNVKFIGSGPTYDSGAIRIHNSASTAGTVDDVSVVIGGSTFDLWGSGLNVPAGGDLILAQTNGQNFDTSDVSGVFNCSPSGLIPQVSVTVAGTRTTYQDKSQVLNTGGIDLAGCPSGTNESQPWTQLGGGLLSSLLFGKLGDPATPQLQLCLIGDAVNCATGNFTQSFDEMSVPGRGVSLDLSLVYNSLAASQSSPVGFGWSFSYGSQLVVNSSAGTATVILGDGNNVPFTLSGGSYSPPSWVMATLTQNGNGTYTYLEKRTQRQFVFSASGSLSTEIDRNGYATRIAYTGSGQISTVTDPAGRAFTFSYGTNGDVASVTDLSNRKVSFSYDGSGNLTGITDVANGVTSFTYDASRNLLTMTDPRHGTLTNTYDGQSRVVTQVDALNRKTAYTYIAGTTTITDPNGDQTREHFSNNEVVALTRGYGTSQEATSTFTYDPSVLGMVSLTDPNNHTSSFSWDSNGNLLSTTDALTRKTTYTYDSLSDLTSITDPLQVTTTLTYDSRGNLLTESRPLASTSQVATTTATYGDPSHLGDITSITDPNGHSWSFGYDSNGNLTSASDPLGDQATFGYDNIGRRTSSVTPDGNVAGGNPSQYTTTHAYNAFGDRTSVTDPLGHTTLYAYDGDRNLSSVTDGSGNQTQYAYDADNELTKITRPDLTVLVNGYDGNGNLTAQTDGNNNATSYTYDPLNRLNSITDPLKRITNLGYDGAGNLITLTNASSLTTTFSFDQANELTGITYASNSTPNATYTYDADGRRATMSDGTGSTSYSYDSLERLTSVKDGLGQQVTYGYDLANNLTSLTYPNGKQVTYTFNRANQMTSAVDWLNNATSFAYDATGNFLTESYPNTTKATLTYDTADQLNQIVDSKSGTTFASFAYTRDKDGLLSSIVPTGVIQGNETYAYTSLSQLAAVNTATYKYDPADNITQLASAISLSYDVADQVKNVTQSGSTTSFAFDTLGNRTSATPPIGAATKYTYDQANRLTKAVVPGGTGLLAGGVDDSLAVRSDGTVWAWGNNTYGELGNGTTTNSSTPVQVSGLTGATTVAAGYYHSLAVKSDGTVWAWGYNNFGQLGNGTFLTNSSTPGQVTGLSGATSVAAGSFHSVALLSNGSVEAWGSNVAGQLGNGTTTLSSTPVQVSGLTNATAIAAGANHSVALRSDGTVWDWGAGKQGQLGNGSTAFSTTPVQVSNLGGVVAIAAGGDTSYALRSDGSVWAWGANNFQQLGNTSAGKTSTVPVQVAISSVTKIGAGFDFGLAIESDGTGWGWGNNNAGQLGNGGSCSKTCPVPVQISNLTNASFIAGGYIHSLVARADGTVWAWGDNSAGELGNGTTTTSFIPVQVSNLRSVQFQITASYAYNGDGLRTSKTVNGATEGFSWNLISPVPLLLQDAGTAFLYGPGDILIEQVAPSGTPTYIHQDEVGSTRLLTDSAGNVAGTYSYSAYGSLTAHTGTAGSPIQFAGEYVDSETGFVYLRARYYDPATAQFISADPYAALTRQPYAYAGDSPLNGTDPSGLQIYCPCPGPWSWLRLCLCPNPPPINPPLPAPPPSPTPNPPTGGGLIGIIAKVLQQLFAKGKWTCSAQCNVEQINPCVICPPRVTGSGSGSSEQDACRAAKRAAVQSAPPGCYARHCYCFNCTKK